MLQQLRINGGVYDHSKTRVDITSAYPVSPMIKNYITEFNFKSAMNGDTNVYGTQVSPLGQTYGNYAAEFGFTILKEGWDLWMSTWPSGFRGIGFDVTISFLNPLSPLGPVSTVYIPDVYIVGTEVSSSTGGKEIDVKVTTLVSGVIEENGKSLIPFDQDLAVL